MFYGESFAAPAPPGRIYKGNNKKCEEKLMNIVFLFKTHAKKNIFFAFFCKVLFHREATSTDPVWSRTLDYSILMIDF